MDWQVKQNRLHDEKISLNQLNLSNEGAEMFLKAQCYTVINLMRDIDQEFGIKGEKEVDILWDGYYNRRNKWHMETSDPIKKKQTYAQFADKELQQLHFDICRTLQKIVDEGELLG